MIHQRPGSEDGHADYLVQILGVRFQLRGIHHRNMEDRRLAVALADRQCLCGMPSITIQTTIGSKTIVSMSSPADGKGTVNLYLKKKGKGV